MFFLSGHLFRDTKVFNLDEGCLLANKGNAIVPNLSAGQSRASLGLELHLHTEGDVEKTEKKLE